MKIHPISDQEMRKGIYCNEICLEQSMKGEISKGSWIPHLFGRSLAFCVFRFRICAAALMQLQASLLSWTLLAAATRCLAPSQQAPAGLIMPRPPLACRYATHGFRYSIITLHSIPASHGDENKRRRTTRVVVVAATRDIGFMVALAHNIEDYS